MSSDNTVKIILFNSCNWCSKSHPSQQGQQDQEEKKKNRSGFNVLSSTARKLVILLFNVKFIWVIMFPLRMSQK